MEKSHEKAEAKPCGKLCCRCNRLYSRHHCGGGVALSVVCAAPSAWFLVAGAVANTLLFFLVSIPMADGRQSRKEGFAEYKKQTRMLLPIRK